MTKYCNYKKPVFRLIKKMMTDNNISIDDLSKYWDEIKV